MSSRLSINSNVKLTNIYGKRLSILELALIFLFPIIFRQFYFYVGIPHIVLRLCSYTSILIPIIFCGKHILLSRYKFNSIPYYMKLVLLAIVISMFVALFSRGQGLFESFKANMGGFFGYIYFFVLYKIKPSAQVLVKLIFIYAIIYLLCYVWAMLNAPNVIFGLREELELDVNRGGIFRLRLGGLGYVVLLFFYSIVKSVSNKKWYILSAGLYTLIVLSLTRQCMLFSLIIAGFFIAKNKIWLRILVGVLAVFMLTIQNINIRVDDSTIIGSLVNMTIEQVESQDEGDDDIRVKSFKAQVFDFHQNFIEVLFGSGMSDGTTGYGRWEQHYFTNKGYWRSDVGYAGTYVTFGIFGMLIFIAMLYRSLTIPNSGEMVFVQLFIYYVVFTNLASWSLRGNCVEICICSYLLCIHNTQQKNIS